MTARAPARAGRITRGRPAAVRDTARSGGGFVERLARGLLCADGALGTMLINKGLGPDEPPELWNLTRPRVIQGIHRAYLAVGCDLVTTNTFGANRLRLKERRLDGEVAKVNRTAVRLARRACSPRHFVAGGVGPTGRFRQGRRYGRSAEIQSAFQEQIAHLSDAGIDLILIETMTHLAEARMALEAAQAWATVSAAVSLVFFEQRGDFRTLDGASPAEAVRELSTAQVVGCNCVDVEVAVEVLRQMREATGLPLIAQPNAGLPERRGERWIYPFGPEALARSVPSMLSSRPAILGGCCGTTPAHLQALIRSARHS
jgi:5-methyltetrahydrofolate--homocysteine methyltransferase